MPAVANFTPIPIKGQPGWNVLRTGPWGYVTEIQFSADGLAAIVRTDVGGAYYGEAPNWDWRQMVTAETLPDPATNYYGEDNAQGDYVYSDSYGVRALAIAPSDKNRVYITWAGYIMRSDDKGLNYTLTSFPRTAFFANAGLGRFCGPQMVVDPLNPDVVYVIGMTTGLWRTLDGGTNWTQVASIAPINDNYDYKYGTVVIDHTSANTGSGATLRKSKVYATSVGRGFYGSTDGGNTFPQISATEDDATHMVVDALGAVYLCESNNFAPRLRRYESGSISNIAVPIQVHTVAVHPVNNNKLIIMDLDGKNAVSNSRGVSWETRNSSVNAESAYSWLQTAEDIPALALASDDNPSTIRYRPTTTELWKPNGIGVFRCMAFPDEATATLGNRPVWVSVSAGIEELIAKGVITPPGGPPLALSMDRPVIRCPNPAAFPASYGPDKTLRHGVDGDFAKDNSAYIAVLASKFGKDPMDYSGYTTDTGRTWTKFNHPPLTVEGGCIAVGSEGNIVVIPGMDGTPVYTLDNGATPWQAITFPGGGPQIPTGANEKGFGFGNAGSMDRKAACNDGTHFYIHNYGPAAVPTLAGVYRSLTGAAWEKRSGSPAPFSAYHPSLDAVPGKTGHLFFSSGPIGGFGSANPEDVDFMFSNDGAATFNAVPGFKEPHFFAFGKGAEGADYPAIWVLGYRGGVFDIWWSKNFNPTTRVGTWVGVGLPPSVNKIRALDACPDTFGKVYVSIDGAGFMYGNFAD